jgi:hypothetical protein
MLHPRPPVVLAHTAHWDQYEVKAVWVDLFLGEFGAIDASARIFEQFLAGHLQTAAADRGR